MTSLVHASTVLLFVTIFVNYCRCNTTPNSTLQGFIHIKALGHGLSQSFQHYIATAQPPLYVLNKDGTSGFVLRLIVILNSVKRAM